MPYACPTQNRKRKKRIASLLQQRLGPLCLNHSRRADWYSSEDGAVDVFITDSKAHYHQRPWFDMRDDDLTKLAEHPTSFIIFIFAARRVFWLFQCVTLWRSFHITARACLRLDLPL